MTTGSVNALPIDLALGSGVGALSSIQNFFGNIGAVSAPIVTGYLVSSTGSFTIALVFAGAMAAVGAASYIFILGDLDKCPSVTNRICDTKQHPRLSQFWGAPFQLLLFLARCTKPRFTMRCFSP